MILKNMPTLKRFLMLILLIGAFSCDEDTFEVTLYDKGTAGATASATSVESGGTVNFNVATTKEYTLEWTFPGGTPATSTNANVDVIFNNPSFSEVLNSEVVLVVKYIDNTTETIKFNIEVASPDSVPDGIPFSGTPISLPGTIEIENYDLGGQGVGYNDNEEENLGAGYSDEYRTDDGPDIEGSTGGPFNIGYANAGEWLDYTITVAEAGAYNFEFEVASGGTDGGGAIQIASIAPITGELTELGEMPAYPNTGGWGTYTTVTAESINLSAGTYTIRLTFTSGSTNVDKVNIVSGVAAPFGPQNIAFVTDGGDDGFIALLEDAGHTVEAESGKYNNLTPELATELNGFDLVIISRSTNSGNFDASIADIWATVTKPVLNMSSYVARSTRLQFFDSANQDEGGGTTIAVQDPSHPIFTGITLESDNSLVVTAVNLHVIVSNDAGNGTLLGLTGDGSNATIAEWDANTAAYAGGTVFPSKRMFLASTGGGLNFNEAGAQLFMNSVEYIVSGTVVGGGGSTGPVTGLGFYTERDISDVLAAENPASNSGNFNISYVTDAAEGSEAIYANFATSGTGNDVTWGAMLSMYPFDGTARVSMDISTYNFYNISLKAPAENTDAVRLRFRTGGGNYWLTLSSANEGNYGFARDGQWHNLKIPLSDLLLDGGGAALDADRNDITEVIFRSDVDAGTLGANFDWYIDDIYFTAN